jgi:hypothetical protein
MLIDMGYQHDEAQTALEASNFDLEGALRLLLRR